MESKEIGSLTFTRRPGEVVIIGDAIRVIVDHISGDLKPRVRLRIVAPTDIPVHRAEVHTALAREGRRFTRRYKHG